jgi:hypothetical protein
VQQHSDARQESLPGILVWHAVRGDFTESAWKTAQQSNVTALMPQDEVRRYTLTYDRIEQVAKSFDVIWPAIVQAPFSVFMIPTRPISRPRSWPKR